MKTSWLKWFAIGLVSMGSATACVVTTDDDPDDDEDGGSSGRATAGRPSAGRSGGGSGGRGGATTGGTGGTTGGGATTGGTSGGGSDVITCEVQGPTSEPADSCEFDEEFLDDPANAEIRDCLVCLSASCCDDLKNCYGQTPNNVCGWGGPTEGQTEYLCYQGCLAEKLEENGIIDDEEDRPACEMECRTVATNGQTCAAIGNYTQEVVLCMHDNCEAQCNIAE